LKPAAETQLSSHEFQGATNPNFARMNKASCDIAIYITRMKRTSNNGMTKSQTSKTTFNTNQSREEKRGGGKLE